MPDPATFYAAEATAAARVESRAERIAERLSIARLVVAVALAATFFAAVYADGSAGARWWWVAATLIGFVALVIAHGRARRAEEAASARRRAAEAGVARVRRDWNAIPPIRGLPSLDARQASLANDLGVTGDVSLFRLLDVCHPALGGTRVLEWLLADPAPVPEIAARAESVRDLRGDPQVLLSFASTGIGNRRITIPGIGQFATWTSTPTNPADVSRSGRMAILSLALAAAVIVLLAIGHGFGRLVPLIIIVQVSSAIAARRHIERELHGVDSTLSQLRDMIRSLDNIVTMRPVAGRVGELQRELRDRGALDAFAALQRLLDWREVRYSPLLHWSLNAAIGLDVLIWHRVLRWRIQHGPDAARWIDAVAEVEAHAALATLGFDNPGWSEAVAHDGTDQPMLTAPSLGHPLIPTTTVVRNDLHLDGPGDVIVVSGSNMAGKTTYLRAAGLNTLLAQAGGPVCADRFTIRRCRVRTSVRVEDDLAHGVSLFLAEARRLQEIVADARITALPPVLFLLDEILHGTNAPDRRAATRLVLHSLAEAKAFGLVTTHDPEISVGVAADERDARQLHFRETVTMDGDNVRMDFDYRARPGPGTTTNALTILKMLGLS